MKTCCLVMGADLSLKFIFKRMPVDWEPFKLLIRKHSPQELSFLNKIKHTQKDYEVFPIDPPEVRIKTLRLLHMSDMNILIYDHTCKVIMDMVKVVSTFNKPLLLLTPDSAKVRSWKLTSKDKKGSHYVRS